MTKKLWQKVRKQAGPIFLLLAVAFLLDEIRLGVEIFQLSDIWAPRFTHEKFVLGFALGGLYIVRKKKSA